mgnify:CR=1 FL=1
MTFYQRLIFKLIRRAITFSRSRFGALGLWVAAILESSVLPVMVEFVALPMMFANRARIPLFVAVIACGTTLGAIITYTIGYYLFDSLGLWLLSTFEMTADYHYLQTQVADHGFWAILLYGMSPLPLHPLMLAAGFMKYAFGWYILAIAITRVARYSLVGAAIYFFGHQLRDYTHQRRRKNLTAKLAATVTGALPPPSERKLDHAA